jgi:hypothetical protein
VAACQAVRAAAREGDTHTLARLLGVEPDGQGQPRGGSAASMDTMRVMLADVDEHGMSAFMHAAENGMVGAMRLLLDHPAVDPAAMLALSDNDGWTVLEMASYAGHVEAMRLLLDHPSAGAKAMMVHANKAGWNSLKLAALQGKSEAMRLLLDHPSADAASMMVARSTEDDSALTAAAGFAAGEPTGTAHALITRSCAPLLLLLRRVAVDPQPCDAQQAHMSRVMEALCQDIQVEDEEEDDEDEEHEEHFRSLFDDDQQPDDARDECVRLLLEHGSDVVRGRNPVMKRIIREALAMARVPQRINEAVLGIAISRRQQPVTMTT